MEACEKLRNPTDRDPVHILMQGLEHDLQYCDAMHGQI
jgi:hypothetical protein